MLRGEVVLHPPGGALPGVDGTLAAAPGVTRRGVVDIQWGADGALTVLYWLTGGRRDGIDEALERDDAVDLYETVDGDGEDLYVFVRTASSDLMANLLAYLEREPVLLETPMRCEGDAWRFSVAGPDDALQRLHDLTADLVALDVERLRAYEPRSASALAALTDRQREALETACALGFYDDPQGASFEDLAGALDCGSSAANALLRRAEAALVGAVLGEKVGD